MRSRAWVFVFIVIFMLACSMPGVGVANKEVATLAPSVDTAGTAVQLTVAAKLAEATDAPVADDPPSETPSVTPSVTHTQCTPTVTATKDANIRSGPGTEYDITGALLLNSTATVAGKNDASTWWYILMPGSTTNYGWIANTVVTPSCLPQSVQVVAAPPTPIPPSPTNTQTPEVVLAPPVAGMPDLVASGMQYWPSPAKNNQPISIQVKVTNNGNAPAGSFNVQWLSNQSTPGCNWTVQGLGVGASKTLDCEFTYHGSATASYWTTLVVDTDGQVTETSEGNNTRDVTLKVKP